MKTLVSILLGTSAAIAAGFAVTAPASAAPYGYYNDDYASYRVYCRDPGYRHRYAYYCDQFYDDDDDYYDDSYYSYSTYPYYDNYYYPYSSYSYYPYSYSYYPYSYYPYSYGPSVGFSFRFGDRDRHHRFYRRHWRH